MKKIICLILIVISTTQVFAIIKIDVTDQYIKNATCTSLEGWNYWGHDIPEYGALWATWHVYNNGSYNLVIAPFIERWVYRGTKLEDGALTQNLTGLPVGRYSVEADIIACQQQGATGKETGTFLFAESDSGKESVSTITDNGVSKHYAIEIDVTNGSLTIGFETINSEMNWIAVDNWKLFRVVESVEDLTDEYIKNANCSSLDGWEYWGHDIPEYLDGTWATWHIYGGNYSNFNPPFIERWVYEGTRLEDGALTQTITGIPSGIYRIEADVIACQQKGATGSETGTFLFAESGSVKESVSTLTENGVPQHYAIEIEVTNGSLTIGFETINSEMNWIAVDNWKLYRIAISDDTNVEQCAKPIIYFDNGTILFECETPDVNYVYEIVDTDIKKGNESEISLEIIYTVSVYATKSGCKSSDKAYATLSWSGITPKIEGAISSDKMIKKGDVNEDGNVDISDIVKVINIIASGDEDGEKDNF